MAMYTEEAEEELLGGRPDFVLDAIDNIDTKVLKTALFCAGGADHCLCHAMAASPEINAASWGSNDRCGTRGVLHPHML